MTDPRPSRRGVRRPGPSTGFRLLSVLLLTVLLPGCDDDGDGVAGPEGGVELGTANMARLAAVGNSLTMGVQDGAIFESGQRCSPPALLAEQVGIDDFEMPLVSDPGISGFPPGAAGGRLRILSLDPLVIEEASPPGAPTNLDLPRPYDNLGVGGALLAEAFLADDAASSLTGNAVFDLVLRGRGNWQDQIEELGATFLVVELSHNDVLLWAAAGGDPALAPGLPVPVPSFALVFQVFLSNVGLAVDQLVVSNLADVTLAPFFTTLPPVVVNPQTGQPVLDPEGNPVPLIGPDGPLSLEDQVLLTALGALQQGVGVPQPLGGTGLPLPDAVVLDVEERTVVRNTLAGYNAAILAAAGDAGVPVWDIAGLLTELAAGGVEAGGETLTSEFIFGGAFSLDGIHPTCKGYGVMANRLIETINAAFGAEIPPVDVSALPAVDLPGAGLRAARGGAPTGAAPGAAPLKTVDGLPAGFGFLVRGLGLPRFEPASAMGPERFRLPRTVPGDPRALIR